ncbi:MAG: enoyl-CoA hydratase/isomerase family protein [Myxococcales bacterium]|nr:enoyl-CoA hydratase/isomerase family protein [Myxococcales bacterium]
MTQEDLVLTDHAGPVATLTIHRPDKMNALNRAVLEALAAAVDALGSRGGTRCAILTGAGKAFVAGADIAGMRDMGAVEASAFAALGHRTFDAIEALPFPVIAAVNGFALGGGCELALACDFIYASERAKLGQPEVGLGIIPGFGGTQRLPRRVGLAMARELIYTGKLIGAEEALRVGLVNAVFPPDALMAAAQETAAQIAAKGPTAVAVAKRVTAEGLDRPLAGANALEVERFAACFDSGEPREGMTAFLEKRPPAFERG